jgi:indole-3-glycerol phosphate synthase
MSFLSEILERKRLEVAERKRRVPEAELVRRCRTLPPARSLGRALSLSGGQVRIIAEVKRASPSAGRLAPSLDPEVLADAYARAGASAVSVLTDGPGFGGSLDDLRAVRAAVEVPVLRKDFVVDPYQLWEARDAGADATLLIVAALERAHLSELATAGPEVGLELLVEVHTEQELNIALEGGAALVGINNRDLGTFKVELETSELLLPRVPRHVRSVAESGIRATGDVRRLRSVGAANFLVGEALVRAPDPGGLLAELLAA